MFFFFLDLLFLFLFCFCDFADLLFVFPFFHFLDLFSSVLTLGINNGSVNIVLDRQKEGMNL